MNIESLYPFAIYVFSAAAVILIAEALYLSFSTTIARRKGINRRLRIITEGTTGSEALIKLKRERGITVESALEITDRLKRLIIQSGLRLTVGRLLISMIAVVALLAVSILTLTTINTVLGLSLSILVGIFLPILVLRTARSRRQSQFVSQLPDALDVIVRSLRSGHPVPVALSLVGRELSDPIGSEFGITVDEMTYGLEVEQALHNLSSRVGHEDLSLLVTAVSLQTSTGGNLAEILSNLSKVIRDRFQLRRKVKALSAEGKFSAYGLTVLPIIIFFAISFQAPNYYAEAWREPMFVPAMLAIIFWSLVGDFIMYKMINFKY